jgi:hypothetical protein
MWSTEHSTETTASPKTIWRIWSEVPLWPEWNGDLERAELAGPFDRCPRGPLSIALDDRSSPTSGAQRG